MQIPPNIKYGSFNFNEIENARIYKKLLALTLLISRQCNLKCLYCYTDAGVPLSNQLKIEEYFSVIEQANKLGARTLWIPGEGEPLLDKSFFLNDNTPIIDFANNREMGVVFFTNGWFITDRLANSLFEKKVSIITKVNSFKEQIQDELTGVKGSFNKLQEGLKNLIGAGFNKGNSYRLGINTVITRQNYHEIPDIFRYCRHNHIIPYISTTIKSGRAIENSHLHINTSEIKELFYRILEIDEKEFGYSWRPSPPIIAGNCQKLLYDIVVTSTGEIGFCPGIDLYIGNIRNESLKNIINKSELLSEIRGIKNKLKGKCGTCKDKDCLYGCRLEAYTNGDLFGEDPTCWK